MNKRNLHHFRSKLQPFSAWYFLVAAILCVAIGLISLRQNNLTAIKLRDKVAVADEQNGDVEAALRELRAFVYSHMNTDLSGSGSIKQPIQLKHRYDRLVAAEKQRVSAINEKVYTDAQRECERAIPTGTIAGRIPCVQDYVNRNTVKEQPIPDGIYKFDFQPPAWSADRAGISLLLAGVFLVLFAARIILDQWLKLTLKHHM